MKDKHIQKVASFIGRRISKLRQLRNIKQTDLADRLEMTAQQLNKIEKGTSLPRPCTLNKIEFHLGLPEDVLVELAREASEIRNYTENADDERLLQTGETSMTEDEVSHLRETILPKLNEYARHQKDLPVRFFTLHLGKMRTTSFEDGMRLAWLLREQLELGIASVRDILPTLEQQNIRILYIDGLPPIRDENKPDRLRSAASFYDMKCDTPVICLNTKASPESQLYDFAYELAEALVFRQKIRDNNASRRPRAHNDNWQFPRGFASEFLMPLSAINSFCDSLDIGTSNWTLPLADALRQRFGVSRDALLWRLYRIKKIPEEQRDFFLAQSSTTPIGSGKASIPPLPQNTWLATLRIRASTSN